MPEIGVIILAAGASRRMGRPKQLLKIGENSLIQYVVKIVKKTSAFAPVIVVLGSDFEKVKNELSTFEVFPVLNQNWEKGIGTSIATGIKEIQKLNPEIQAVIILLADQPKVEASLLAKIVKLYQQTGKKIIASKYAKTIGVPTLIDQSIFQELESLTGDKGAKKIIQQFADKNEVAFIDFPGGKLDLDTLSDYDRFLKDFEKNEE